ncbi:MAG: GNAT family N-acetyltransferase, partial [Opitutaceae bacterium]
PDLPLLRQWLNTPHVYAWWGCHVGPGALGGSGPDVATLEQVETKYGLNIDHGGTTHRYVILFAGQAIGLIQWYHLRDFADYASALGEDAATSAGLDLLIGEPSAVGRGLGSRSCDQFVTTIVFPEAAVKRIVAGPTKTNLRSIRAFEKAAFRWARDAVVPGESLPIAVMVRAL